MSIHGCPCVELSTSLTVDVGAHLHEGGGFAPELAAGGAAVEADTRGGGESDPAQA